MKKINLMLAAGMMAFAACSNNEDVAKGNEENGVQNFVLQVASSGDGLTTRGGRPLYSAEAAQDIDNVKLVVYSGSDVVYEKTLTDWKTVSKAYTTNGHGLQYTLSLKGADKLQAGDYKVLAVGYTTSENSSYTYSPELTSLRKDETYTAPITATTKDGEEAEEVFAGEVDLTVPEDNDNAFASTVTLHRQVAGGFGYFKNIPASIDNVKATTLRLVASAKNTAVKFENFNSAFTATTGAQYIVNGATPATTEEGVLFSDGETNGYVVYSINLTAIYPNGDADKDGKYNETGESDWVNPTNGLNIVAGSVFAGKFMIPFGYVDGKNTMELQLLSKEGAILKHWTVKIPAADLAQDKKTPEVNDQSVSVYNVVRNHMYNIGVKADNNTPNPEEKPDTEQPEDLSKGQDIILKVNDNWELIHKMELE